MNPRGNFVLKNLHPGKYDISVRSLRNFYLDEAHAESRKGSEEILERGLTVPEDAAPPTLAMVLKSGAAEISGTIEGASTGDLFSVALVVMLGPSRFP